MKPEHYEMLDRSYDAPPGRERIAILEELVRVADADKEIPLAYECRRRLTQECNDAGFPEKAIVAFSWCLAEYDKDDELDDWHSLLWQYKVILEYIPVFASVSRAQIIEMQEDMARRLLEHGQTERTAHYYRSWNFMRMGDYDVALAHQEKYMAMRRGPTSDCEACERDRQVELLSRMRRDKEAMKLAQPILKGRSMCREVPEFTNGHMTRSLIRLNKWKKAKSRFAEAYQRVSQERKYLGTIGDLMLVPLRDRDLDTALSQVLRHLPWANESVAGELKLRFYSSVALFFELLASTRPEPLRLKIPRELEIWNPEEQYSPNELATFFAGQTRDLVQRFNDRNGNTTYNSYLEDSREIAQMV